MTNYFRPPSDYRPPRRCVLKECNGVIIFTPCIGGHRWRHLGTSDHDVVMRRAGYWDTTTGETVHGNPLRHDDASKHRVAGFVGAATLDREGNGE